MNGTIQVVGATGFIGQHVFDALAQGGKSVIGVSRTKSRYANLPPERQVAFGREGACVADGVSAVVFCAGLAHIQNPSVEEVAAFREVNVDLPVGYAKAAIAAGARRFLYISSIGVHGEGSVDPFSETSGFAPADEYSRSKVLAEARLREVFQGADTDLVIVRPPMVYGFNAPGNYARLVSLVQKGLPLPFGGLGNPRSFISIQNLVSFLVRCIDHSNAGGQTFVVSDNDDTTTCDFVREIASAQGRSVRLLPVPRWLFVAGLTLLGQGRAARKLSAPLTVDCSHAMNTLDWQPPYSLREGVRLSFESSR
ncbi:NAD-dependent epimerase/dehydratase family protein [Marinobacter sp. P4B1]|uniref:NAD-dependent epimerase/dehydratase family protein n=1 Tax=Marinobacter sp. P4B1 TaxID=1119533 RepID=UPI00071C43AC|nr:NAD-dependent epimerase/dehydratase family protein [Marinobacter sp. P4B1]KRW82144.1 hypothetical protein AQ621_11060 [Marinobacter sp. P4B1]